MADPSATSAYTGWSVAEAEADQALAASIRALGQADGLLNPALDAILARRRPTLGRGHLPTLGPVETGKPGLCRS